MQIVPQPCSQFLPSAFSGFCWATEKEWRWSRLLPPFSSSFFLLFPLFSSLPSSINETEKRVWRGVGALHRRASPIQWVFGHLEEVVSSTSSFPVIERRWRRVELHSVELGSFPPPRGLTLLCGLPWGGCSSPELEWAPTFFQWSSKLRERLSGALDRRWSPKGELGRWRWWEALCVSFEVHTPFLAFNFAWKLCEYADWYVEDSC